jgi:spectinomycin phosphotransferase
MREPPAISEQRLRACLHAQYDFVPVTLEFLPLGLDYNAGVYRVASERGTPYLLKVKSGTLYEPGCLVPRYLSDQGITSIAAPFPTRTNSLWARLEDWTLILYPFIDGEASWTGMTDTQWQEVGTIFKRIHQATLPPFGFESLRTETFDPTQYARWIGAFETQHAHSGGGASPSQRALRSSWMAHRRAIHIVATSLERLSGVLQRKSLPHVICHADLHQANLIRDSFGRVFVIDWDDVMLAPKERDFIFVKEPATGGPSSLISPFFQGYGRTETDWTALTYFRYERVAQDLIECARRVFFSDELGEPARASAVQLFHEILAEGGMIDAANTAAAHLRSDLGVHAG